MNNSQIFIESFLFLSIFILGLIAYIKSDKKNSNYSLVFVFTSFLIHLLFNISVISGVITHFPIFILIDQIDGYVFSLAILYHIMDVTKVKISLLSMYVVVAVGTIVSIYYYTQFTSLNEINKEIEIDRLIHFKLDKMFLYPMAFIQISNLIAAIYILGIYKKFKLRILNFLSDDTLKTKQYVLIFFLVYISLIIIYTFFVLFFPSESIQYIVIPVTVYFFFFIIFMIYTKIPAFEQEQNIIMAQINDGNSKKELIDESLKQKIEQIIIEKQLFKNPNFSLFDLSRELSISTKDLSQFLNHQLHTNFSTFINGFRVNEAKRLLDENIHKNLTFEAIAELSGFNNRVTFYRAFKKLEKISPSDYII